MDRVSADIQAESVANGRSENRSRRRSWRRGQCTEGIGPVSGNDDCWNVDVKGTEGFPERDGECRRDLQADEDVDLYKTTLDKEVTAGRNLDPERPESSAEVSREATVIEADGKRSRESEDGRITYRH